MVNLLHIANNYCQLYCGQISSNSVAREFAAIEHKIVAILLLMRYVTATIISIIIRQYKRGNQILWKLSKQQ